MPAMGAGVVNPLATVKYTDAGLRRAAASARRRSVLCDCTGSSQRARLPGLRLPPLAPPHLHLLFYSPPPPPRDDLPGPVSLERVKLLNNRPLDRKDHVPSLLSFL